MGRVDHSFRNATAVIGDVAVVDADPRVGEALRLLLGVEGLSCRIFADGESFLQTQNLQATLCVVLEVQLPGQSGLDVLRALKGHGFSGPVLMMSGLSNVSIAVETMKLGARDFVEKPFAAGAMTERIRHAVASTERLTPNRVKGLPQFAGAALLTARERDVLSEIAKGASNKEAGRLLGISPRTIEVHRARIMDKLGAKNAADLMRIVLMSARTSQSGWARADLMLAD